MGAWLFLSLMRQMLLKQGVNVVQVDMLFTLSIFTQFTLKYQML
jgi:hypothetical protein